MLDRPGGEGPPEGPLRKKRGQGCESELVNQEEYEAVRSISDGS